MSNFPQSLDCIPMVPPVTASSSTANLKIPTGILPALNDAIEAIEGHIAFGLQDGGTTRVHGTTVVAGSTKELVTLHGTYVVTPAQDNKYSIFIPVSGLLDESQVNNVSPTPAPDLNGAPQYSPSPLIKTESPLFVAARRRNFGNSMLHCGVTSDLSGNALIAASLPANFSNKQSSYLDPSNPLTPSFASAFTFCEGTGNPTDSVLQQPLALTPGVLWNLNGEQECYLSASTGTAASTFSDTSSQNYLGATSTLPSGNLEREIVFRYRSLGQDTADLGTDAGFSVTWGSTGTSDNLPSYWSVGVGGFTKNATSTVNHPGELWVSVYDPSQIVTYTSGLSDGDWHMVFVSWSPSTGLYWRVDDDIATPIDWSYPALNTKLSGTAYISIFGAAVDFVYVFNNQLEEIDRTHMVTNPYQFFQPSKEDVFHAGEVLNLNLLMLGG